MHAHWIGLHLISCLILFIDSDDQHEHDTRRPVYESPPPKYTAERILQILLNPDIPECKVCWEKPKDIRASAIHTYM